MLDIIIIIILSFLIVDDREVGSSRYFANFFVGLLFKSNMYYGMKTERIDLTVLFVSEKGMGSPVLSILTKLYWFPNAKKLSR